MVKRRYTQFLRIDVMAESIDEAKKIIANELNGRENVSYVHTAFENEVKPVTTTQTNDNRDDQIRRLEQIGRS